VQIQQQHKANGMTAWSPVEPRGHQEEWPSLAGAKGAMELDPYMLITPTWSFHKVSLHQRSVQCHIILHHDASTRVTPPSGAPVAHFYNPCCSGGRAQEDQGWKPGQIVHETLSETLHKKGLEEWLMW
jgi:hypothetical protein